MVEDDRTELALLRQRVEVLEKQVARTVSHQKSQGRVDDERGKRMDSIIKDILQLERKTDRYDKVLYNDGRGGIVLDVDRLKTWQSRQKEKLPLIVSLIAIGITIIEFIMRRLK